MMAKRKNRGVVLKNKDYKENACLVTLLTKEGIINLIVRGAKKANSKTRILTNQYSVIDFCQTDTNSLNTLTEGVVVDSNLPLYKDVLKLNYAQVIVEKILVLANSLSSFDILYDFFLQTIKLLGETSYPEIVVLLFEVKLWYLLGIAPNFQSCPRCGKKNIRGSFTISAGGIICSECLKKQNFVNNGLSLDASEVLKWLYLIKMNQINEKFLELIIPFYQILNQLVDEYYQEYLGYTSASKVVLSKLIK